MREEPFGPLAMINPVSSLDEAIEKSNALPYGLAAYAFTRSASNVDQLTEGVEVGNLSINNFIASIPETPFGGVKDSGYGRREERKACRTTRSSRTFLTQSSKRHATNQEARITSPRLLLEQLLSIAG